MTLALRMGPHAFLILTPTHKILASRGDVAELWNDEGRLHGVLWGHTDDITDVKFSPDTNLAISCSWDGSTKPWEVGSQECLFTLRHQEGAVTGSFSTTGTTVVTTTVANALKLWCARSGDCISTLTFRHQDTFDFAFTAQGVNVYTPHSTRLQHLVEHGDGHPCVGAPRRFPFVVHVAHMLVQMR